ncbi:MAG: response regulator RpfG family c-di-GMP phosphodiesterase [Cyclobacteriaceae bacterium]|jgi:response regulator RpfG family c-di-GMP phosphodiesterase
MFSKKGVILFVDDEYYILQTLKAILRRDFLDYHLLFAQKADDAFELLDQLEEREMTTLLVLSDWLMPGLKGDEFLVQIALKYPQSKNFLLSGMINKEPAADIFERAKILQIIQKPWDNQTLIELLKKHLS